MPTLRVVTSPSQNLLLDALINNISSFPLPPLVTENITVLSNGMARWISMELAIRLGVSAGVEYSYPNDLLDRSFRAILPDANSSTPFSVTSLTWRIASKLPALATTDGFEQVSAYLGNGLDDRRLLQISGSIANCFDQYTIFRPEMVCGWDKGDDNHWQARLWRAINADCHGNHRAALLKAVQHHVTSGAPPYSPLPNRISLFGISYLPPFHLEALRLISEYCEVTCYLLNPCGEYWGTIISEKRKSRLTLSLPLQSEAVEFYDTGNPLLSSLGTLGQDFFESLLEYDFKEESVDNLTEAANCNLDDEHFSLLSIIQNDVITLFDRTSSTSKSVIPENDRSVQIHSCHGALREMEILYDSLLAHFDELTDLEPRHIIVLIPDIETYTPYINSVFGNRSAGRPFLPYAIADRSIRRESMFIDAFLRILDNASSRFALHDILDLLELPLIRSRFNISESELSTISTWLSDCNVRWGFDADQRSALGFPHYNDFSWQAGLDRLFLGYAMASDNSATFQGILPYHACSGLQAEALGKLMEFITIFRQCSDRLSRKHTLPEWANVYTETIDQLLQPDEKDSTGPLTVAKALNSLREACSHHGFTKSIAHDAVRDHLVEILTKSSGGYGFMGGAITFCTLLPMRSIPMRVVWLAGMNDGQFPRMERTPGFNLMNGARRRGDRSLRDEDRYLFLEALMAAENRFCISYNGQSHRDNSSVPPSVLVSEMVDYIKKGFVGSDAVSPASVLVRHRLQSFSTLYFDRKDPDCLFSYDRECCEAIETRRLSGRSRRKFITEPLPLDPASVLHINLQQLRRFLTNPAAAFLEHRLRFYPFCPADIPAEAEPFSLDSLTRYSISQNLVDQLLKGAGYEECLAAARSRGNLPPLAAGKAVFDTVWENSRRFAATVEPRLGSLLGPLSVNFTTETVLLNAVIENSRNNMHAVWRCTGMKGKDRLTVWLDHLLLNIARMDEYPVQSVMIATDSILELTPLEDAAATLTDLLNLYREGMQRPLRFFPETSWAYLKGGQQKAESPWRGDQRRGFPGECNNQAVVICFGDEEPWGEEFHSLSERIYAPLLSAIR